MSLTRLLAFDDEAAPALALAAALGLPLDFIGRHRFPDGEIKLTLPAALSGSVVLLRSLYPPNERLVELLIAAPAARDLGAQRVLLACPYLAYMRQDMAFSPGQAVSQRHIGALLAHTFDAVVTVDPHLHRIASLDEVMPAGRGLAVSAAPLLGHFLAQHTLPASPPTLLLGPDEESAQWVQAAAHTAQLPAAWCRKLRHGDHAVTVALPDGLDVAGRPVVLVDDMASTGRTLVAAAQLCRAAGATQVDVAVTHALFTGDALAALHAAGIQRVWSSDSVHHVSNALSLAPLLAQALLSL